jgi:hypothetical protein
MQDAQTVGSDEHPEGGPQATRQIEVRQTLGQRRKDSTGGLDDEARELAGTARAHPIGPGRHGFGSDALAFSPSGEGRRYRIGEPIEWVRTRVFHVKRGRLESGGISIDGSSV